MTTLEQKRATHRARSAKYGFDLFGNYCPACQFRVIGNPGDVCKLCGDARLLNRAQEAIYTRSVRRWIEARERAEKAIR